MNFQIPLALKAEHEELHGELVRATKAGGSTGEAAKAVAKLMHPHFVKEEEYALPPLGLLTALSKGKIESGMAEVLKMTDKLEAELPHMLAEHKDIVTALQRLVEAAKAENKPEYVRFANQRLPGPILPQQNLLGAQAQDHTCQFLGSSLRAVMLRTTVFIEGIHRCRRSAQRGFDPALDRSETRLRIVVADLASELRDLQQLPHWCRQETRLIEILGARNHHPDDFIVDEDWAAGGSFPALLKADVVADPEFE